MYRGISLKKDPPRPSRKGGSSASRTKAAKPSAMSFGRSMHLWCGSKQQGCVQCAEARFKNCKAAVQCPAGFQCSGAAVLSPLRYESVSKEPSAKQQSCVQYDEGAVQREWSQVTISWRTSSEMVSSIFPYSVAAPVWACWNRWLRPGYSL